MIRGEHGSRVIAGRKIPVAVWGTTGLAVFQMTEGITDRATYWAMCRIAGRVTRPIAVRVAWRIAEEVLRGIAVQIALLTMDEIVL